ncbi:MAG: Gfo/Idh/MocA family oxidoreductase [Chloroflexota bacterium]
MSERAPLRAAIIGCGHISQQHIPAWQACPDAELVAVCDLDREKAEQRARQFGVPRVYTDVAAMLRDEPLDCVDVATRPESHRALTALISGQGKHVLCQKPLAPTMDEAQEIVRIAESNGVRFMVLEMFRHIPGYLDIKRYLDQGLIGPVHAMRILGLRRPMNRSHPVNPEQPYFAEMPKLLVYEMVIHWIDAARSVLGDVDTVYSRMVRVNPIIAGEDQALVVLGHTSGATTLIDSSWASPSERGPSALGVGGGDTLVEGRDGSLHLDAQTAELRHVTNDGVTVLERYGTDRRGPSQAFAGCIADFAGAIRHGRPFVSDGHDNLKTLAATLAAYESAAGSRVVPVGGLAL